MSVWAWVKGRIKFWSIFRNALIFHAESDPSVEPSADTPPHKMSKKSLQKLNASGTRTIYLFLTKRVIDCLFLFLLLIPLDWSAPFLWCLPASGESIDLSRASWKIRNFSNQVVHFQLGEKGFQIQFRILQIGKRPRTGKLQINFNLHVTLLEGELLYVAGLNVNSFHRSTT